MNNAPSTTLRSPGPTGPHILLVNPWIEDFAAFDLWFRPLGLLTVGAMLETAGARVTLVDCLAREWVGGTEREFGTGKFPSRRIAKPDSLAWAPRDFYHYGMTEDTFRELILTLPAPDFILITCQMTYWYRGAFGAATLLRQHFPRARILLGGIYAFLCPDHARASGRFDDVLPTKDLPQLADDLSRILGIDVPAAAPPAPAYHLYGRPLTHAALLTGTGCPFRCTYCATPLMYPCLRRKSPHAAVEELDRILTVCRAPDIAFYDDALLARPESHILPLLNLLDRDRPTCRFHLPNAIHPRWITPEMAVLMRRTGFHTLRLGFESLDPAFLPHSNHKVNLDAITRGVDALHSAGFDHRHLGAYVMFGVPGQSVAATLADLETVHRLGLKVYPASYSPIPGTTDFETAASQWPELREEPLLHNNTLSMLRHPEDYSRVKTRALALNHILDQRPIPRP